MYKVNIEGIGVRRWKWQVEKAGGKDRWKRQVEKTDVELAGVA